ncbi:MAG: hypothetical protein WA718_05030 [Terriglobales bacterium]
MKKATKKKEHWMELCELASKEQDPVRLSELIEAVNSMLLEKEDHLKAPKMPPPDPG